jgi:hypothetical protein
MISNTSMHTSMVTCNPALDRCEGGVKVSVFLVVEGTRYRTYLGPPCGCHYDQLDQQRKGHKPEEDQ